MGIDDAGLESSEKRGGKKPHKATENNQIGSESIHRVTEVARPGFAIHALLETENKSGDPPLVGMLEACGLLV